MKVQDRVCIWKKYGAYLIGITNISNQNPNITFEEFIHACDGQYGGWSIDAIKNAWNKGRI